MADENADETERERSASSDPTGTVFGATFGPFGWAMGSVVDENRVGFGFAVGTGASGDDDGLDDAVTIEIEEADEPATSGDSEPGDAPE